MALKRRDGTPVGSTPTSLTLNPTGSHPPLAINFHCPDGRIFGFPYAHLVCWLYEKNPDSDLQPHAPSDRFSLWFSTHDVVLLGWRLSSLPVTLQENKLVSVQVIEGRYIGLSADDPFVCEISVQKQGAD